MCLLKLQLICNTARKRNLECLPRPYILLHVGAENEKWPSRWIDRTFLRHLRSTLLYSEFHRDKAIQECFLGARTPLRGRMQAYSSGKMKITWRSRHFRQPARRTRSPSGIRQNTWRAALSTLCMRSDKFGDNAHEHADEVLGAPFGIICRICRSPPPSFTEVAW